MINFWGIYPPQRGVLIWVWLSMAKGGFEAPKTPKIHDFGPFWPFLAKKQLKTPKTRGMTPSKWPFLAIFAQNPGPPPANFEKSQKCLYFADLNCQNFRKVMEKRAFFGQSWGFWPFWLIFDHFCSFLTIFWWFDRLCLCQYPYDTSSSWPLLCLLVFVVSTAKGSQRLRPSMIYLT